MMRAYSPALTPAQFQRIMAELPQRWHPVAEWLGVTGIRIGETAALTTADIDAAAGTCRVTRVWVPAGRFWELQQSRCGRTVLVPEQVLAGMDLTRCDEELFSIDGALGPGLMRGFSRAWRGAVVAAHEDLGGRRTHVHDLRRMCGAQLLRAGVPLPEVAAQLGWSVQVTAEQVARTVGA
ncbi:tyrosine-type recombinase/integrase [Nocardia sp. NPDC059246]|uniref:tyrosine-type recombinase/integrase n=1 Tax=unclassified Nocardia TaxID=2637762 RepID=UPI0036BFB9F4